MNKEGLLGVWAAKFGEYFDLREELFDVVLNKLN